MPAGANTGRGGLMEQQIKINLKDNVWLVEYATISIEATGDFFLDQAAWATQAQKAAKEWVEDGPIWYPKGTMLDVYVKSLAKPHEVFDPNDIARIFSVVSCGGGGWWGENGERGMAVKKAIDTALGNAGLSSFVDLVHVMRSSDPIFKMWIQQANVDCNVQNGRSSFLTSDKDVKMELVEGSEVDGPYYYWSRCFNVSIHAPMYVVQVDRMSNEFCRVSREVHDIMVFDSIDEDGIKKLVEYLTR